MARRKTYRPGTSVVFARPEAAFAHMTGNVFTVESATHGVGGMMPRDARESIAAGFAHIVMADEIGRRVGTTADRIDAV